MQDRRPPAAITRVRRCGWRGEGEKEADARRASHKWLQRLAKIHTNHDCLTDWG